MSSADEIRKMVGGFEAVVQEVYPEFENCEPDVFQKRLDNTMRASAALMSAGCAAYIKFYGPEAGARMFSILLGSIQQLTAMNLKAESGQEASQALHQGKLH